MSSSEATNVRLLFERLADADEATRAAVLAEVRKTDPAAADEAAELLRHHHRTDVLLDQPAPQALSLGPPPRTPASALPKSIGRYAIVGELGRGGMGVVYEAQQESPHRRVALKVVRPELVTPTMLRRFAQEAEVLGRLRHPGIAQVYEAGSADDSDGFPRTFIAMELCRGRSIVDAAEKRRLPIPHRIRLLAEVCDAVDHAHRRGVIHRDLKPGNILVEDEITRDTTPGSGLGGLRVKILDFGIARVVEEGAPAVTAHTSLGQVVGTLAYMSPEQAGGEIASVDTRSDVYALGAVLYELLCRKPPLRVSGTSLAGALAIIQKKEPELAGRVNPDLRGDIEAILAKALEKDPARRYASAAEFGADLRRYLADEPVLAHPQTSWYQLRKFARRNWQLVSFSAAIILALTGGVIGTGWQAYAAIQAREKAVKAQDQLAIQLAETSRLREEERSARGRAEAEADTSKRVTEFLVDLLRKAHPEYGGASLTVKAALESSAADVDSRFQDKPAVRLDVHSVLGSAFGALGDNQRSELHYRKAWELTKDSLISTPQHRAAAAAQLANAMQNIDRVREAEPFLRAEYAIAKSALPEKDPELAGLGMRLGDILTETRHYDEAEPLLRSALEVRREVLGAQHRDTLVAINQYALLLAALNRYAEAEPLQRENLAGCLKTLGPDHPDTNAARTNLASALRALDRAAESLPLTEEALATSIKVLGEDHPDSLAIADQLGIMLIALKNYDRSIAVLSRARDLAIAKLGPTSLRAMGLTNNLANVYERAGRPADAEPLLRDLLKNLIALGREPARAAMVRYALARVLRNTAKPEEALAVLRELPEDLSTLFPTKSPFPGQARSALGALLSTSGKLDEAEPILRDAYRLLVDSVGEDHPAARAAAKYLAEHFQRAGNPDESALWSKRAASP